MKFQEAGRLGGLQTSLRHGIEHYKKLGRFGILGGRPKLPSISELRRQKEIKEEQLPTGLKELKLAYKRKRAGIDWTVPASEG